jgi:hypothetical protein
MSAIVAPTSDAAPRDQPIDILASRSLVGTRHASFRRVYRPGRRSRV